MNCKNCGAELEENLTVCPECGELLDAEPQKEKKVRKKIEWTKKKIIKLVLAIVAGLLALSLVAGIIVLALRTNDVHYKKKYMTSDFWTNLTHDQVVATMGEHELTNGLFQVFFWMQVYDFEEYYMEQYGEYAMYYLGLDLDQPLHEQACTAKPELTWEQYFVEDALYAWHRYQSLADEAVKNGYKLPGEYQKMLADMKESTEKSAKSNGYASADAMLQELLGASVTFEDYYRYQEMYMTGELYFSEVISKLKFTDAEMDAFFEKKAEEYAQYGVTKESGNLVDFRSILVKPVATKDADGNKIYTEEAWKDCEKKAQDILDSWLEGGKTEETFSSLATLKSEDVNTSDYGGLYQYIAKNDWALVDVRHILITPEGGTKNESGTNVTYSEEEWEACRVEAQKVLDEYLAGEKTEKAFGELANKHSDDQGGKVTNGGLYSDVPVGKMVKPFEKWIFDDSRKPGDTGLVKTEYGYHVMYFVKRNAPVDDWVFAEGRKAGDYGMVKTDEGYRILFYVGDEPAWEVITQKDLMSETVENMRQSYVDARPIEVKYWALMLSQRVKKEATTQQTVS